MRGFLQRPRPGVRQEGGDEVMLNCARVVNALRYAAGSPPYSFERISKLLRFIDLFARRKYGGV